VDVIPAILLAHLLRNGLPLNRNWEEIVGVDSSSLGIGLKGNDIVE